MEIQRLYFATRGGLAGPGPLPFRGGWADQPAALMRCLDHMRGVEARLRPPDKSGKSDER
ncbi:hypothetical protein [Oceanibaculum indicum]|uniref:hypothetical protein n=1 Tax=Oceanibaculum indicum TaxID=526216 RepID=UPI0002F75024|nr:hypothetical protein [Oceanibaculum indicum]